MSAVVKLSSAMPGDFEVNGVDAMAEALTLGPKTLRCAVVWFDVKDIKQDVDTGEYVPTIRLRRIEPLGDADDVTKTIRKEVEAAMERRTGRTPIPWDVVEITEERYSDTLPESDD